MVQRRVLEKEEVEKQAKPPVVQQIVPSNVAATLPPITHNLVSHNQHESVNSAGRHHNIGHGPQQSSNTIYPFPGPFDAPHVPQTYPAISYAPLNYHHSDWRHEMADSSSGHAFPQAPYGYYYNNFPN